jgi:hypothetical protein
LHLSYILSIIERIEVKKPGPKAHVFDVGIKIIVHPDVPEADPEGNQMRK